MPQYFSPGVYVEEVDSGPRPIQGVSTSVTGAVGVTLRGPTAGKPVLVTSFNEFQQTFGGFLPEPDRATALKWEDTTAQRGVWWRFAHAVRGFFDNGGQQLYVKRVVSKEAAASSRVLTQGVVSEILADADRGARTLSVRHVIGLPVPREGDITGATKADPVVITSSGHKLNDGDKIRISSVGGMSEINDKEFTVVSVAPNTFELSTVDGTGFTDYTSGGKWVQVNVSESLSVAIHNGQTHASIQLADFVSYSSSTSESTLQLKDGLQQPVSALRNDYVVVRSSANINRVRVTARSPGAWGNDVRVQIRPVIGESLRLENNSDVGDTEAVERLTAPSTLGGDITDATEENPVVITSKDHSLSNGDRIRVSGVGGMTEINDRDFVVDEVTPSTFQLKDEDGTAHTAYSGGGKWTAERSAKATTWHITLASGHGLTATDTVSIDEEKLQLLSPVLAGATFSVQRSARATPWTSGTPVRKLRRANDAGKASTDIFVSGADRLYPRAIVSVDNGSRQELRRVVRVVDNQVILDAKLNLQYFEQDVVQVIEAEFSAEYAPSGTVRQQETFTNLKIQTDQRDDDPLWLVNHVNRRSQLVRIDVDPDSTTKPIDLSSADFSHFPIASPNGGFAQLDDGDDALESLETDAFIGADGGSGKRTGIKSFEDIDDISLVMAPGMWARSIVAELLRHCDALKYRMAILDSPYNASIQHVRQFRTQFDSKRAALYYPWVRVRDPVVGEDVVAPPSGHVAGIYAEVDSRRGFHKAPANEVIRSITQINQDVTRREQDLINPRGINALRFFPGRGNRVWGARTVSSDTNFRYINVRRIFNFIEASIDNGTQFVVFEPNDETLWARVRQTVRNFLNTQWRSGVLEGSVPEEAYFVECDRGITMTQDDIENGRLICEVGIAPVFPAEFVIFRIQKFTADSKLS